METSLADHLAWARSKYPEFAKSSGDYLDGIIHEAENNVRPIFLVVIMILVGICLATVNNILANQGALGIDELPMWLVTLAFMAASALSEPLAATWIRRSIRARVETALRSGKLA